MLTQAMPALAQALNGVLPDAAVRQLMQAMGNCQQSLSHRGDVSLSNDLRTLPNGTARMGVWSPSQYTSILPKAGEGGFVDVPKGGNTSNYNTWNSTTNQNSNQFSFPLSSEFTTNQYYGGPTLTVFGDTRLGDLITNNAKIENLEVTNIYNVNPDGGDSPPPGDPTGGGGGGGGDQPGGGGGGGLGGANPGISFPAAVAYKTIVTNVRARPATFKYTRAAKVSYPDADLTVKLKTQPATGAVSTTGTITLTIPTSGKIDAINATGSGTVAIPTSATLSGLSLSSSSLTIPTSCAVTADGAATLSGLSLSSSSFALPTGCTVTADGAATLSGLSLSSSSFALPTSCAVTADGAATMTGTSATSSAVSFAIPNAVTLPAFTGTCSAINIPTSASIPAGVTATLTIPDVVTGGTLDENCNLVLTTGPKSYTVTLPAMTVNLFTTPTTPTITVTPSGTATLSTATQQVTPTITVKQGTITLPTFTGKLTTTTTTPTITVNSHGTIALPTFTGKLTTTNTTPTISVNSHGTITLPTFTGKLTTTSVTPTITVNSHGTIALTTKNTDIAVSVTAPSANVSLTTSQQEVVVEAEGNATYDAVVSATVNPKTDMTPEYEDKETEVQIDPLLNTSKDFLIYYRPRF